MILRTVISLGRASEWVGASRLITTSSTTCQVDRLNESENLTFWAYLLYLRVMESKRKNKLE